MKQGKGRVEMKRKRKKINGNRRQKRNEIDIKDNSQNYIKKKNNNMKPKIVY